PDPPAAQPAEVLRAQRPRPRRAGDRLPRTKCGGRAPASSPEAGVTPVLARTLASVVPSERLPNLVRDARFSRIAQAASIGGGRRGAYSMQPSAIGDLVMPAAVEPPRLVADNRRSDRYQGAGKDSGGPRSRVPR